LPLCGNYFAVNMRRCPLSIKDRYCRRPGSLLRLQVFASLFTYGEFAAKTTIYGLL
jgi:hypothetical protein